MYSHANIRQSVGVGRTAQDDNMLVREVMARTNCELIHFLSTTYIMGTPFAGYNY